MPVEPNTAISKQNIPAISISGTVTDTEGEPLIGVNIQIKGTTIGTSSDFDGNYTLNNVEEDATLVFSYVGYQKQEVAVDGKAVLNIQMATDAQMLEELVVVGYGTQKKVNLTGAVSTLNVVPFPMLPV